MKKLQEESPLGYGRYRVITDKNDQLIDAEIIEVNTGFEHYFAKPRKEIIGKSKFEFFKAFYEGQESEWRRKYSEVALEGNHFIDTVYFKPGQVYFEMNVSSPIKGEFITLFRDVTYKVEKEVLFEDILSNSSEAIFLTGDNGDFKYISPNVTSLFGFDEDEMADLGTIDLVIGEDYKSFLKKGTKSGDVLVKNYELSMVDKYGQIHYLIIDIKRVSFLGGSLMFTCRDITESKLADKRSEQEREKLKALLDTIPDLIWMKDPQGKYLACNHEFEKFYGAQEKDILGKTDRDFVSAELADFFRKHDLRAMNANKPMSNEEELVYKTIDKTILAETTKTPFYSKDGTLVGVLGVARDITARKITEKELIAREEKFRKVVDSSLDAVVMSDAKGNIVEWNGQAEKIFGFKKNEVMYQPLSDLIVPKKHREAHERGMANYRKTGKGPALNTRFEITASRKDETEFPVEMSIVDLEVQGKPYFCSFIKDLTEKNEAEEALEKSEVDLEKYRRFFNIANDNFCIADPNGILIELNPQFPKTLGYTLEELTGKNFLDFVHPDDLDKTLKEMENLGAGGTTINFRNRYKKKSGGYCYFEWISAPHDGFYYAVARDVTRTMQYQKELKLRDQNLHKFFEKVHVGIAKNSMDGAFVEINPEFERFTGYSVDELNSMSYWDLTPEKYALQEEVQLKSLKEKGKYGPYQKEYITRDGDLIPVLLNGVRTVDAEGNEYIWSVVQDLSESERNKEKLRQDVEKFKVLLDTGKLVAFEVDMGTNEIRTIRDRIKIDTSSFPMEEITSFDDFFSTIKEDHQVSCFKKMKKMTSGEIDSFTCDIQVRKGDRYFWHQGILSVLEVCPDGKVKKVFITLRNIEDEKNQELIRLKSQEKERLRVARDIHDSIGQMLVGTRMTLRTKLGACEGLDGLDELLHDMIQECRIIINNFGISVQVEDLKASFEDLIHKMDKVYPGKIELNWYGKENLDDLKLATYFFRIFQEGLSNAIKYSDSPMIKVDIKNHSNFEMRLTDFGVGFDTTKVSRGFGMNNMNERAEEIGYQLLVDSSIGDGTNILLKQD